MVQAIDGNYRTTAEIAERAGIDPAEAVFELNQMLRSLPPKIQRRMRKGEPTWRRPGASKRNANIRRVK